MRAEHTLNIPLGLVAEDDEGEVWVFIGWRRNRAGNEAFFARVPPQGSVYVYHASMAEALVRKFPALAALERRPI